MKHSLAISALICAFTLTACGTGLEINLPAPAHSECSDLDDDGQCDADDPCPEDNPDDTDSDGVCDSDDPCPNDDPDDTDSDGQCDSIDPCPADANDSCLAPCFGHGGDTDGDGQCDDSDACPNDDPDDTDGDGVCDSDDPCPSDNPDDTDSDGQCDSDDPCPNDAADACLTPCFGHGGDTDGDAVCDDVDLCPNDNPNDTDGDGLCDSDDSCPNLTNSGSDSDLDGVDDVCDACDGDDSSGDSDNDDNCDDIDPCPNDNTDSCGPCDASGGDTDGDGTCDDDDVCPNDNANDSDGDGVCDSDDPCPDDNPDDTDSDGQCDSDDPCPNDNADDTDGDGACDSDDPCPNDPTDACADPCNGHDGDTDSDGQCDDADVCPDDNTNTCCHATMTCTEGSCGLTYNGFFVGGGGNPSAWEIHFPYDATDEEGSGSPITIYSSTYHVTFMTDVNTNALKAALVAGFPSSWSVSGNFSESMVLRNGTNDIVVYIEFDPDNYTGDYFLRVDTDFNCNSDTPCGDGAIDNKCAYACDFGVTSSQPCDTPGTDVDGNPYWGTNNTCVNGLHAGNCIVQ
ncbi:hypothetical protein K2X33_10710 [bacterium]|nr:hypothetical protein [bacterium]